MLKWTRESKTIAPAVSIEQSNLVLRSVRASIRYNR